MQVKPQSYTGLVGASKGKLRTLQTLVLRKPISVKRQNMKLKKPSICIVCNYSFYEKKISWSKRIKAICHPFHDDKIFPSSVPKFLLSESDFCDKLVTDTKIQKKKFAQMNYDFIYFTLLSTQGINCKGLYMLDMIDKAAEIAGLRGLVVNYDSGFSNPRKNRKYINDLKSIRSKWKHLNQCKCISQHMTTGSVCAAMKAAKFVLFPNTADASPRLIVESLVRGRPVLVNKNIYGGWKYVNKNTGRFFDAPSAKEYHKCDLSSYTNGLSEAMQSVIKIDKNKVGASYYSEYGFLNASRKLAKIVAKTTGEKYDLVCFKEWKNILRRVAKNEGLI